MLPHLNILPPQLEVVDVVCQMLKSNFKKRLIFVRLNGTDPRLIW